MDTQEKYLRQLQNLFWENGFIPEYNQIERLANFARLLAKKNNNLNLISKRDVNSIIENHVFISAYLSTHIPDRVNKFLDIGTGGGFPGIPIAIVRPLLQGVLVDSIKKKVDAVNEFIDKLMLGNIIVENYRVESLEFLTKYSDTFDLIISRATVSLIKLIDYALPLIKEKAYLASLKGGELDDEIKIAEIKYKPHIKKLTVFELSYKPNNTRNEKEKKLVLLELIK